MAKKSKRRTSADGRYKGINVWVHRQLLHKLDEDADMNGRSRRAHLERIICSYFKIKPNTLP